MCMGTARAQNAETSKNRLAMMDAIASGNAPKKKAKKDK